MVNGLIALIPARANSKRIPGKNIKRFGGHPLIAYAISEAKKADLFEGIYVSSDSMEIGTIAEYYGANWIKRPPEFSRDLSPDVEFIIHAMGLVSCETFFILRPTNPFRTHETILRAWDMWDRRHCMKAIEKVIQHPGKMWVFENNYAMDHFGGVAATVTMMMKHIPWRYPFEHLVATQNLGEVFIQNACLEIRPRELMNGEDFAYQSFLTMGREGFDLNHEDDLILAEALLQRGLVRLPEIGKEPYNGKSI